MKHIGKTENNEVIVSLSMRDINTLMMLTDSASENYLDELKITPKDEGLKIKIIESANWWNILHNIRKTI